MLEFTSSFISCIPYFLLNIFSKFACSLLLIQPLFYSFPELFSRNISSLLDLILNISREFFYASVF
nr:MAG TPA: hypothetical protein [Caudoviricetes sp.]